MTTITYTQSTYDPDKILEPGQYRGAVSDTKIVDDPVEGDVLQIIWDVEGFTLTDNLKICSPSVKKSGYAQWKLRNIATGLGLMAPPKKDAGEKLTYDISAFKGKSCLVDVSHFLSSQGKNIAVIDRYSPSPEMAAQAGFVLPQAPVSTTEMLDDEIPL